MNEAVKSLNLSPTAQATLLLTSYFSKASSEAIKPLSIAEWARFALWLKEKEISPADLLVAHPQILLQDWSDPKISTDRIIQLLNRGHSLALAMEKWHRAGLWIVTRSDPEYPKRLKKRLKNDAPPVLFGCGEKTLLNTGGLAVIGSRNACHDDLSYTQQLSTKAAYQSITIVSGGARGIDETAMLSAIQNGGQVLGILPDSLLKAATSAKWRPGLMAGHALLMSPFYPEAGFSVGHAMARNKYIYCMADSALVIHSGKKGGTLTGALENLKMGWVPLWVKPTVDPNAANADLVAQGGNWCEAKMATLNVLDLLSCQKTDLSQIENQSMDLFSSPIQPELFTEPLNKLELEFPQDRVPTTEVTEEIIQSDQIDNDLQSVDFYPLFIAKINYLAIKPVTVDALVEQLGLHKSQVNIWLKQATDEGIVKKLKRPVRYQIQTMH